MVEWKNNTKLKIIRKHLGSEHHWVNLILHNRGKILVGVEILCFCSSILSQSSFPYLSLFMLLGPLSHSNPLISLFLNHNLSHVLRLLKMCPGVRMKIIGPVITFICRSQRSTLALLQSLLELQFSAQNKKKQIIFISL